MKLQLLPSLEIKEKDLIEGILCVLDGYRNQLKFDDPQHTKLSKLIDHIEYNNCSLDYVDGKYYLMIDGVCFEEELVDPYQPEALDDEITQS